MQKIPDDPSIGNTLVTIVKSGKDGIKTTSLFEVEKGKLEEAYGLAIKRMFEYHDIEGYRYKIQTAFKGAELTELLGLTPL